MRQNLRLEVERILRSQQTSAMLVTHDREEAFALADKVGVMIDGRMLQVDAPERVYHLPSSPQVALLTGACDFIEGSIKPDGAVDTELGVLECEFPDGAARPGERASILVRPDDLELDAGRRGRRRCRIARVQGRPGNLLRAPGERRGGALPASFLLHPARRHARPGHPRQDHPVRRVQGAFAPDANEPVPD